MSASALLDGNGVRPSEVVLSIFSPAVIAVLQMIALSVTDSVS